MIRIVIADDEELIRGALVALLSLEADIEVVADVADGEAAVAAAVAHRPDLTLLDLEMPGLDGVDAARRLLRLVPTRVVIVTRHARPGTLKRALSAGVHGFVPKSTPASELARIIRSVAAGERYIDARLAASALTEQESPLTARETDVLRLTRDGLPTKEIARQLGLAHGTARNHISSAMTKLDVDSRTAAATIAWEQGWI
ncbi:MULTISPECIES: response regulator transcription factor [Micromonospora]|uniref:Two component transcriptional regulator, LuxR family n=1 Tax=Micromonospora rifamycinica TaxID=291594 RepID=A0A109IFH6_9ACTN|nr:MULTISPECIES: response regulator transcription factor [Micromonospora]KWV29590.1 LuxR family transcriptional regulator [Micromonospora rifamycinica]WFE97664.1 response regulator transcription factor [Micromonospora sp. WMMD987]SCG46233.1 two component transcriptional regulator, LuxR family [Micromonospora rifamycinica]